MKMKKIMSVATSVCLMSAMVFGCSDVKETSDSSETSETTTVETTDVEVETESTTAKETEETTTKATEETEEDTNNSIDTTYIDVNDYLCYEEYNFNNKEVYIPVIKPTEDFSYGDINTSFEEFASVVLTDSMLSSSDFRVCEVDDGIISICQIRYGESDYVDFNAVTIDLNSGKALTNDEILAYCGYTTDSLYENASMSLQTILDNYFLRMGIDEETKDNMFESGFGVDEYELTFSKDTVNSDMIMFIGSDGNLLLSSPVFSLGSSSLSNDIYDMNGNSYISHQRQIIDEQGYETLENLEFADILIPEIDEN